MHYGTMLKRSLYGFVIIVAILIGLLSFKMVNVVPTDTLESTFSSKNSASHIKAISQIPHPMGTTENEQVRDYIIDELTKLGITAEIQPTQVPAYYVMIGEPEILVDIYNIFAIIPGTNPTGSIALVGHYDTVPATSGANDDGSAVATLLETARCLLAGPPLMNDVLLVFTDAEEPGQYRYGARYFVDNYENIDDIKLVLNFEALGRSGPSIMFETTPGNELLIKGLSKATTNPIAFSFMSDLYKLVGKGGTDLIAFEEYGIRGMDFVYPFERTIYHTALDNSDNLDERSLQHHGNYAVDITRYFGKRDLNELASAEHGDYVFHSFFGNTLLYYPQSLVNPLVIISGVLLIILIIAGIRRKMLTHGGVLLSTLIFTAELLIIVVIATLAWWGLDEVHLAFGVVVEPTIKAHLFFAAFLILSFIAMVLFRKLTEKRISDLNRSLGPIVFWWLVTLLFGLYLPGFSIIMVFPLLFSMVPLVMILFARNGISSWKYLVLTSISTFVIIGITIAPVYLLFQAMGVSSPGFSGSPSFPILGLSMVFWVMLVSLLLPQLRIFGDIGQKRIVYSILSIAFIILITGVLLPGINVETLWIY
ncbi:M28 family peptidase [Chloroflexota bacterium]